MTTKSPTRKTLTALLASAGITALLVLGAAQLMSGTASWMPVLASLEQSGFTPLLKLLPALVPLLLALVMVLRRKRPAAKSE